MQGAVHTACVNVRSRNKSNRTVPARHLWPLVPLTRVLESCLPSCALQPWTFFCSQVNDNCAAVRLLPPQLKHAKLARQLDSAAAAEQAASERVEELQQELMDCSSTCRSRMRWLEQAASDAARRTQQLHRCLQNAAPLGVGGMGVHVCSLVLWHCLVFMPVAPVLQQWLFYLLAAGCSLAAFA